jgi:tight adherence protein B
MPAVLALTAAYGMHLLFTALTLGWTGLGPGPSTTTRRAGSGRRRLEDWLAQAGLEASAPAELAGVVAVLALAGGVVAFGLFGGVLPTLVGAGFAATFPLAAARARRERRRLDARDAWPRLIEEIRMGTTTLGRSIPQALIEVGRRAPEDMRPGFEAAHREWVLSTDFGRTIAVLKSRLADATADTVCETLLVAHAIGGSDVDRALTALVDDRIMDQQGRKDAKSHQAGAAFARRFVLVVPLGMALIGLSIGDGRRAYATPTGQLLVLVGLAIVVACWIWAGQIMRLPAEQRVLFDGGSP